MIVDSTGSFRTQRQLPKMALIKPSLEGDFLVLNAPHKNPLSVPIQNQNSIKKSYRFFCLDFIINEKIILNLNIVTDSINAE